MRASVMMAMPVIATRFGRHRRSPAPQFAIVRTTATATAMTELARSTDLSQLAFLSRVDRERCDEADDADEPSDDRHRGEADHQEHSAGHEQREDRGVVPPVDNMVLRELIATCGVGSKQLLLDPLDPMVELVDVHSICSFFSYEWVGDAAATPPRVSQRL
jgi:hypothetical protein